MSDAEARQQTDRLTWKDRYAYTPLRDALKGRWRPRPTMQRVLGASELPENLTALIARVVRKSRLWKREQLEVARELIAHFSDGLHAGRRAEQLEGDFGNADAAAKLIRRAKKRNRPMWWRASRRTLQGMAIAPLVLLAFYIPVIVLFLSRSPVIKHDYAADLNRVAASVPPQDQAWPLYREALLVFRSPENNSEYLVFIGNASVAQRPEQKEWQEAEATLKKFQPQLDLIRQAAMKPGLGFQATHSHTLEDQRLWPVDHASVKTPLLAESTLSLLLPYLGEARNMMWFLAFDMRRAVLQGDSQRALQNFNATLGLADHVREVPLIINDLVGLAITARALQELSDALRARPGLFREAQLLELAHRLAEISDNRLLIRFSGERMGFEDTIQRLYSDDGRGNGRITWEGLQMLKLVDFPQDSTWLQTAWEKFTTPALSLVVANRRDMMNEFNRLMNVVESQRSLPLWEWRVDQFEVEIETLAADPMSRAKFMPIVMMMPALSASTRQGQFLIQQRDALLVAIALTLHHKRNGNWPDDLNQLVPSLLPAVPPDRFDGKPIRYGVIDGQPLLYSIGLNRLDDGGAVPSNWRHPSQRWISASRAHEMINQGTSHQLPDGDWILWPRPPEMQVD